MSDFKQLTAYTNVKCKCVAPTLPPCDLLAKCDWDDDELHVYIAEWPEVVYVWVDEKTMPYAPVVADVRSLRAENDKLRVELTDLRLKSCPGCGIKVENEKLRDQLEEQKCFAADLERDVRALRELVRHMRRCLDREYTELGIDFIATRCEDCEYDNASGRCDFDSRMAELGVEL